MKIEDQDQQDPFTPGTPPPDPVVKDKSGLYLVAIILVGIAIFAATQYFGR